MAQCLIGKMKNGEINLEDESKNGGGGGRWLASAFCGELLRRKSVLLLPAAEYDGYEDIYFRLSLARKDLDGLQGLREFMVEIRLRNDS